MNELYKLSNMIAINDLAFQKLGNKGLLGGSFADLLMPILRLRNGKNQRKECD